MDSLPFLCQPKSEGIQPCPGSALAFPRQGMWSSPSNFPAWPCKASTCLSFHSTAGHGNICNSSPNQSGFGQELLFPGMALPAQIWRFLSDFIHLEPSCLALGNLPSARQWKFHNMTWLISIVCHPIILASKAQMGILSWLNLFDPTKFTVQNSKVLWFILPCTGTPSPCKPKGNIFPMGSPKLSQALANLLAKKLPSSGMPSSQTLLWRK